MEEQTYSVSIQTLIDRFKLREIYVTEDMKSNLISDMDVNRPGLQLAGFYDYFGNNRIQIIGRIEHTYLSQLEESERIAKVTALFKHRIPLLVITRNLEPFPEMLTLAKEYEVPIAGIGYSTSQFLSALIAYLNNVLAPRVTRHGVLVEVYGEGILMLGESGVGKSEAAIELVKRGHRLVADDAVEIKKVSAISLVGSAPEIIRHFIELRGVGIIDVKKIFGMGAVKDTEKIDMVINLESWVDGKLYDRLGLVEEKTNILGIDVPSILIPVKPGRNIAIIIEVAAMNNRQKKMGYNAAEELNKRLMSEMENNLK